VNPCNTISRIAGRSSSPASARDGPAAARRGKGGQDRRERSPVQRRQGTEPQRRTRNEGTRVAAREQRKYVTATLKEGDKIVYKDVAVHLKGAAGSFRGIDDKASLTVNMDKLADGQRLPRH
jgi:hypothetical protein